MLRPDRLGCSKPQLGWFSSEVTVKICAVIPAHNCERYVAAAIKSVLAQTKRVDDIIVVDDGSTDSTAAVLDRFAGRIRIIRQNRYGATRALNAGIALTSAEILTFLDADDLWLPQKNQRQYEALVADRAVEAVFGAVQQFVSPELLRDDEPAPLQEPQPGISKITLMIRRSAFDRIGLFDESMKVADFVEWYTRAAHAGLRTLALDEVVALRRLHGANIGIVRRDEQAQEVLISLKRLLDCKRERARTG